MQKIIFTIFAVIIMAVMLTTAANAQTPTPKPADPKAVEEEGIIKVNSRLVVVPVSVTDPGGEPVTGLKAENFQLLEEGRKQVIDQVSDAEKTPLEIALLIDVSGSVNPLFEFEKKAAAQFLESVMKPDDRATIFLIGDKPLSNLERGSAAEAATRVRAVTLSGKFTAFYDTVAAAAKYLQKNAPERSRRVIIAITDGEDNWSDLTREAEKGTYRDIDVNNLTADTRNKLAEKTNSAHVKAQTAVLKELQNADTVFYVLNPAGENYKLNTISKRAQIGMSRFADETGGTSFLPKFLPTTMKDEYQNASNTTKNVATLDKIFRQLANELRAQYLIQYYSEAEFPVNKYVKLDVSPQGRPSLRARARQGYYVK